MANGHPVFAAMYNLITSGAEKKVVSRLRRELLQRADGDVLELGVGTGANLPHYPPSVGLTGIEPDPHMRARAAKKAESLSIPMTILDALAEDLPFPGDSFDTVVSTLVLCTVTDPVNALSEVQRVLKPDGKFLFFEHIRSETPFEARVQDLITPVWRFVGGGCHPNREIHPLIESSGLEVTHLQTHRLGTPPIRPQIAGEARPHQPFGWKKSTLIETLPQ